MKPHLNWLTVVLLFGILVCIAFMPRVNYSTIMSKIIQVERDQAGLKATFAAHNELLDGTETSARRKAFLNLVDLLSRQQDEIAAQYAELIETESQLKATSAEHGDRLLRLEQTRFLDSESSASTRLFTEDYTSPLELDEPLKQFSAKLSARAIAERGVYALIETLAEEESLKLHEQQLSDEVRADINRIFMRYKALIDSINLQQDRFIQEQVEIANNHGNFTEVPHGSPPMVQRGEFKGVSFFKAIPESNSRRYYFFPMEEHPEIEHFASLQENAKNHLLREILLAKTRIASR